MNSASKYAVLVLSVTLFTGCAEKKTKTVPPPQAQAPSINSGEGVLFPPPLTTTNPTPEKAPPALPPPTAAKVEPPPPPPPAVKKKTPSSHKNKPSAAKTTAATSDSTTAPAPASASSQTPSPAEAPVQQAASEAPSGATPIGQISTGDVASGAQTRRETVDLITSTETGLNNIKRTLSTQEQETATQIKAFLTKAKQALTTDDIDGAHTLATKAKVLLDELTKE